MDKKMVICHLTSAHKSNDMRIFQKECTSLAKVSGFEVYLVAQGKSREENGVHVIGIGETGGGRINRMLKVSKQIYKQAVALKADIYHFHDPELLLYAKKLKKLGSKVVFDSHEYYSKQIIEKPYLPTSFRKMIAWLYNAYETNVSGKIDAVVIPATINGKNPFEGRTRNTILLDNCPIVDERRTYAERKKPRSVHDLKVCYVGGLSEARGITKLVKGCYKAGVQLILAGPFISAEYEEQIFTMKESKCVDYRGVCSYDEVTEIYYEAHIGAATLLKVGQYALLENLPTKTYEYMQVGLPVIMSDTDYNSKLMETEDFAYLVDPENEDEITDMIKDIYQNYDKAVEKTKFAHKLIEQKYNWNTGVQKLVGLYKEL